MNNSKTKHSLLYDIALVLVIIAGFWFRSVGLDWDDGQHLHPDERFLTMVESAIVPVELTTEMGHYLFLSRAMLLSGSERQAMGACI